MVHFTTLIVLSLLAFSALSMAAPTGRQSEDNSPNNSPTSDEENEETPSSRNNNKKTDSGANGNDSESSEEEEDEDEDETKSNVDAGSNTRYQGRHRSNNRANVEEYDSELNDKATEKRIWNNIDGRLQRELRRLGNSTSTFRKAMGRLNRIDYHDSKRLHVDLEGNVFVVEDPIQPSTLRRRSSAMESRRIRRMFSTTPTSYASDGIPIHHSMSGATRVIYLDFNGMTITGSSWNTGATTYVALPFDQDGNLNTFSAGEKLAMTAIWARVAEDYAPFQVDVTTQQPTTFTTTTARILVTHSVDANGLLMPMSSSGGVAYVNVFGTATYGLTSPAFVYYNNLGGGREDYVAEACSHEMGHNLGLSHDGVGGASPQAYFSGAGTGVTSWAPIMGVSYNRAVTKFNNGDYPNANNLEDDLAIISAKLPYRADDFGNTIATASVIGTSTGSFQGAGTIGNRADVDVFSLNSGGGWLNITLQPFFATAYTSGNNLDISAKLTDINGNVLAISDSVSTSAAALAVIVVNGQYFLHVSGAGNPSVPYSSYGSVGQYVFSGNTFARTRTLYSASMATSASLAGWTYSSTTTVWAQGTPVCPAGRKPTDRSVFGTVITGTCFYPEPIATADQAISPSISSVGYPIVNVKFDRHLRVSADDVASIRGCKSSCAALWSNTGAVTDSTWTSVSLSLATATYGNTSFKLRFGIATSTAVGSANTGWSISNLVVTGTMI